MIQTYRDVCPVNNCEHWQTRSAFPTEEARQQHWHRHMRDAHGLNVTVSFGSDAPSPAKVTPETGLNAILRGIKEAPDRPVAISYWLTRVTNEITGLLNEDQ